MEHSEALTAAVTAYHDHTAAEAATGQTARDLNRKYRVQGTGSTPDKVRAKIATAETPEEGAWIEAALNLTLANAALIEAGGTMAELRAAIQ